MTFIEVAIIIGSFVVSSSFYFINKAAHRPANGELKTLSRLGDKILANTNSLHFIRTQQK